MLTGARRARPDAYRNTVAASLQKGHSFTLHTRLLIPSEAAHLFQDDGAHPFRSIVAQRSD
jgi:hypothetical protein